MADMRDPMASLGITPELLAARRFRFLAEADRSVFETIRCGVLFIMAFWSGSARQAFSVLKQVMSAVDPSGQLELVVVDTDGCPDLYDVPELFGKMHGAGETVWVTDGRIMTTSGLGFHPESFEPNTRALLEQCRF
jgi:hypothetical protein